MILVREALRAVTEGPWITRREFATRTGIEWAEMARAAVAWPEVPVNQGVAMCVRAALLEVSLGIHFSPGERAAWLSGTPDE